MLKWLKPYLQVKTTILFFGLVGAGILAYFIAFGPLVEPAAPRMKMKTQGQVKLLEEVIFSLSFTTNLNSTWRGQGNRGVLDNGALFGILSAEGNAIVHSAGANWANLAAC